MKRTITLAAVLLAFGATSMASSDFTYPDFDSKHKPFSFKMAKSEDMKAYSNDLEHYLADTDAMIQMLITKKRAAIDAYNAGVREYNSDTFFHKDRFEPYTYDESYHQVKRSGKHSYHDFGDTVIITTDTSMPIFVDDTHKKKDEDEFTRMMRHMEKHLGLNRW